MMTEHVEGQCHDSSVVTTYDVEAVNRKDDRSLYASRPAIYPKLAHGTFRRLKWILMAVTLGIYYLIPWIRWDRGPDLPNQAVLLDMQHERFFLFGLEIWPQEFYFVTGLLVLAALVLFLVTSVAGRVWCGYFCPQTVWTDLMISVERFWQGDRNARIRLDKAPWSLEKTYKKVATHVTWLLIGLATGGAFVFYFADAPTLLRDLVSGTAAVEAYVFLGLFTLTTYGLGGIAREQVCIYMCPWPRIQGAMVDHDTFLVGYREDRGEPRGSHRKDQSWDGRGDCVDCKACVAVCPVGIDIRDGAQLECIQCALCIDACDDIMQKVGRPTRLIAYDTIANQDAAKTGEIAKPKIFRARTLVYLALIGLVSALMLWALSQRSLLEANVIPDRNPYFVRLSNGDIRNGFALKILNKLHEPRTFKVDIENLPNATLRIAGQADGDQTVKVPTDVLSEVRIFVVVPKDDAMQLASHGHSFNFIVRDIESGRITRRLSTFRRPSQ
ncbi:MAG: cytochrome c oxidase accessory protein CcoG [Alphaproteobacteria bacterium]|nr:cytochrome c oxidase accessory protein CcoG [Alphaproteobacteria bacterium]